MTQVYDGRSGIDDDDVLWVQFQNLRKRCSAEKRFLVLSRMSHVAWQADAVERSTDVCQCVMSYGAYIEFRFRTVPLLKCYSNSTVLLVHGP